MDRCLAKLLQHLERGQGLRDDHGVFHEGANVGVFGCSKKIFSVQDSDDAIQIVVAYRKSRIKTTRYLGP